MPVSRPEVTGIRTYHGYTYDELISQCVFYKGEAEDPKGEDSENHIFWYYEQRWVEMASGKNGEEDFRLLDEYVKGWHEDGMTDFCKDDGVDTSLKALLLGRFIHWGSSLEGAIAQFKGFYLENYGKVRIALDSHS